MELPPQPKIGSPGADPDTPTAPSAPTDVAVPEDPDTPAEVAIAEAIADDVVMEHDSHTILIILSIAAAFLFVALLVAGWFAYDAFYATPGRALNTFLGALDQGDDARLEEMLREDVLRDLDTLDMDGTAQAIEQGCAISPGELDFTRESQTSARARFVAPTDGGTVTIALVKVGYSAWKIDEIRSATLATRTEPVEPQATEYEDTPLLAQGVELVRAAGEPGEAQVTYEVPLVNGIAQEPQETGREVVSEPGPTSMWRGTGAPDDSGVTVHDIQTGTGAIDGEPGVTAPAAVMPLGESEYLVSYQFDPTPAGTTTQVYWLPPTGAAVEDELWDPDDSWTWSWVRYSLSSDKAKIVPGQWVAAIHIDGRPAGYATFEIER